MASYHCHVKVGAKGKAGPHADYILRQGKYESRKGLEELESSGSRNMPKWAEHKPTIFWQAADEHERANGSAYREIEVALPRELTPKQRLNLVNDFLERAYGKSHAVTFAIHNPKSALDGGEQPHAHIMYSERVLDGIDRDPSQFFKRYNAKSPEKGGCKKDSAGTEERLQETRELWAQVQNEHLARLGHDARVDHRSLKDQGIQRAPQRHIPRKEWAALTEVDISKILNMRAAEGELERAQRIVSFIDVSGDLRSALKERERKQIDEFKRAAAEAKAEREAAAAKALELMRSRFQQPTPTPAPRPVVVQKPEPPKKPAPTPTPTISVADGMSAFRAQFDAAKLQAERQKAEQERQAKEREAQQRQAKLREQSRARSQSNEYKPRGPTR